MDVIFDKLAKLELDDAAQYYELQIPGLGIRFEEEVKRGIRRVLEYPNAWAMETSVPDSVASQVNALSQ